MNNLIKRETYENDAVACILSNLIEGPKRRNENSIWGPVEMPVEKKNLNVLYNSIQNKKYEINEGVKRRNEISIRGPVEMPVERKDCNVLYNSNQNKKYENVVPVKKMLPHHSMEKALSSQESDDATQVKIPKIMDHEVLSKTDVLNKKALEQVPSYQQEPNGKKDTAVENDQHMESSETHEQVYNRVPENNVQSSDTLSENAVINDHENMEQKTTPLKEQNTISKKVVLTSFLGTSGKKEFNNWGKKRSQVFMPKFNFANANEQSSILKNTKVKLLEGDETNIHEHSTNSSKQVFRMVAGDDDKISNKVQNVKLNKQSNSMVVRTLLSSNTARIDFQNWCDERNRLSKLSSNPSELSSASKGITHKENTKDEEKIPVIPHSKKNSVSIPVENSKSIHSKRNATESKSVSNRNDKINATKDFSGSKPIEKNVHNLPANGKTKLSIKLTEEKSKKIFDLTVEQFDILRLKKRLPKLFAVIPNIDLGTKEINYSAETVNIILRYVLRRNFNFDDMPSPTASVEVLAATQSWEIYDFREKFREKFLKSVLTHSNVNVVFSHASHFSLKDICDACQEVTSDNTPLNPIAYKKKQKICFISVSIYVAPSEIDIPFHPLNRDFGISFERHIVNRFTFESISGSYTVTGFQIQLNEEHLERSDENKLFKIDYSINGIRNNRESKSGREQKPFRPINVVDFMEHLVINPKEVVEVIVETDVRPYLCSEDKERKIIVKNHAKELSLIVDSDFKVQNSDTKLFTVAKFFYYAKL